MVQVTHISTVNISKLATDGANITIANNYKVKFELLITIFKFDRD